ncbi:MAG TPA: malonyl-CoA synthase [Paracoccaceae bacterium]|nr:malonyl-CoA synthase [Paracoccaceae bacterium]
MGNHLYDALFQPHRASARPFLILQDRTELSYDAFLRMTAQYAGALQELGLKPGDRIALQLEKSPQMLAVIAAAIAAGVVFLPLNTAYTPAELSYFVTDAGARVLLADASRREALEPVAGKAGARLLTLNADGTGSFADLARPMPEDFQPVARAPGDLAAFLYTSGTTGRSKGAMLSHDNLLSNAEVLVKAWQFTADDVLLHALPIFHTHGLFVATNVALLAGCPMIFLPKFEADQVIGLLPRATTMMGVPTFYTRLLADPRLDRTLTKGIRLFVSGSAPLLAETHRQWQDRTGHTILERYGMTETNMNTSNPYLGARRAGTVGLPLPGIEVKVCDPSGAELPRGEIGVIEVRGPNVFQGYWQMPEKTREELRPNGFFITGDLGVMGADGYVTIVGRAKDLVISGGFNIYPKEVEDHLDALPGVLESAVIGVPHPDFGEAVVAVVVAARGAALDPAALRESLSRDLAKFKQPKHIAIVGDLPRNTMGKVQKNLLRDQFKGLFQ